MTPPVDLFDGPEIAATIGQLANFAGVVVVGLIAGKANVNARAARVQVENDHQDAPQPNLRVDLDAKDAAAQTRDKRMGKKVDALIGQVTLLTRAVTTLQHSDQANRDDIDDLMDTEQRRRDGSEWAPPATRRDRRTR